MHAETVKISPVEIVKAGPLEREQLPRIVFGSFVWVGILIFFSALLTDYPNKLLWGSFYVNMLFWLGLSVGAVMTTTILQIVRATWSAPIRRIAEAHLSFLPWAFTLFLLSYFGRHELFPWANAPMPGREWWMQPGFVYTRFAVLLALLFALIFYYTRLSLRSDIGFARESAPEMKCWKGFMYAQLGRAWKGSALEIPDLQRRMSILAPVVVLCYVVVWTLFSTEMINSTDTIWYSNMFGGFQFLGNIFMGWAVIAVWSIVLARRNQILAKLIGRRQLWDLGMLMLGFCMLWGYTFFAQFLPQWYGNLPEETQWLILRSREMPWKAIGYLTFFCSFVIPFILLLSEDVKKNPRTLTIVAAIVFLGIWMEKYIVIMPQLSPDSIPFGLVDIGIFMAMLGLYGLSMLGFFRKFPIVAASHPQYKGDTTSW